MARDTQLPEAIIQHIQSLLTKREATRTAVLSKFWHRAWYTRPVLHFDERDFVSMIFRGFPNEFANLMRITMERYRIMNLNLVKFILWMIADDYQSTALADHSILRALNLGVNDLYLEISPSTYVLPWQVFDSKCLSKLSVSHCKIDLSISKGGFIGSRIVSLSLCLVGIEDDVMRSILLGCSLIEVLKVHDCRGLGRVNVSVVPKLKHFSARQRLPDAQLLVEFDDTNGGSVTCGRDIGCVYRRLISLELDKVSIDDDLLSNKFVLRFPCLEGLRIKDCEGYKDIEISSKSVMRKLFARGDQV